MDHIEAFFHSQDEMELYYQRWQTEREPRAIVALVHGICEHSGRYINVVNALIPAGYTVYGYDHRGHGRSPGPRVYINHWSEYREDLKAFLDLIGKLEPGKPIFLYGHSMGGLVALDYLLHYSQGLKGAVISSPTNEIALSRPWLVPLGRAITGILPRFSMKNGIDITALSRDQDVGKAYVADPMVTRRATARWFTEMLGTAAWVRAHVIEISLPVLMIHGDADRLNYVRGTRYLFEKITYPDKTLHIYPGGYHEPHNDINHAQVLADVKNWLDQHSSIP